MSDFNNFRDGYFWEYDNGERWLAEVYVHDGLVTHHSSSEQFPGEDVIVGFDPDEIPQFIEILTAVYNRYKEESNNG